MFAVRDDVHISSDFHMQYHRLNCQLTDIVHITNFSCCIALYYCTEMISQQRPVMLVH